MLLEDSRALYFWEELADVLVVTGPYILFARHINPEHYLLLYCDRLYS